MDGFVDPLASKSGGMDGFVDPISQQGQSSLSSRAKKQNKGFLSDTATDVKRGIEQIPGAVTGLVDIVNPLTYVTGQRMADNAANWVGEKTGFQPSKWEKQAAEEYSPERKASDAAINKAWEEGGVGNIAGTYLTNPRSVLGVIGQSAPSMLAGGGVARLGMKGLAAAGGVDVAALRGAAAAGNEAAANTLNKMATTAGAIGEGAVTAGQNMDQVSRDADPRLAALTSLAAGVGTGAIGKASGRLANRLGIPDIETTMAGGGAGTSPLSLSKRIAAGAAQEGLLQEAPQSAQEQMWQNIAEGKPLGEGVARQAIEGALAGAAMGGGAAIQGGRKSSTANSGVDNAGTESKPPAAAGGLTYQPGLVPGIDVGAPPQPTIPASDMQGIDFTSSPVYGPSAPISRADGMPAIDFTAEPKLPEGGPISAAVNVGIDSGATSLRGNGSFSGMSEFANLVGQEQQDVQQRRNSIVGRQALRREVELQDADARVADQMAKEAAQRRRNVLDQVLSDPTTQNPAERFSAELQRQGFRDSTPTADELATVQRFNDIKSAQPVGPEIEPSLPNELDAEQFGIRSRKGPTGQKSSGRDKVAEVRQLVGDGWKISNKTLVSPTGKKRILNTAEHAAAKEAIRERNLASMEAYRQIKSNAVVDPATNVANGETSAAKPEKVDQEAPQANDAQTESQPGAAPQAEGIAQPEQTEVKPAIAQSDIEDYGKRVVRRNKPLSKWTAEEIQDRLARADSGESPISDESRAQLQAALAPIVAANNEKQFKAAEQAERGRKMQAAKAVNKDTFQIGESKDSLERVSVRDGVVHLGEYPATDYNSGDEIKVPDGATKQQVLDALIAGEAVTKKAKVWGKNGPEQSVADRISELQAERDAMSKVAQKYADQIESAIAVGEQEGISAAEVMADIGANNEEVGQVQGSSQEGANDNDGSSGAAKEGGGEKRAGDAQGEKREVKTDGRVALYSMAATSADKLKSEVTRWSDVVEQFLTKKLDRTKTYTLLSNTPASMQALGLPDLEVRTGPHMMDYANVRLTREQMDALPIELANPKAVYIHDGNNGLSINFVTGIERNGDRLVIALRPNQYLREALNYGRNKAHFVATVVNVRENRIVGEFRNGNGLYVEAKDSLDGLRDAVDFAQKKNGRKASEVREQMSRTYNLSSLMKRLAYKSDLVNAISSGKAQYSVAQDEQGNSISRKEAEQRILSMLGDKLGQVLLDSGIISFTNKGNAYQGATYANGNIALNLDSLTDANFDGVFQHEGFHSTIKELVGLETYAKLMKQLDGLLKIGNGAQWVKDARAAVPSDTKKENVTEEVAAYAIEQYVNGGKIPNVLQRWAQNFLSTIRTAIIKHMPDGKLKSWAIANITAQDMSKLAISGLKAKAAGQLQANRQEAIAYSKNEKQASVDASITEIFDGLAGRGIKKVRAEERLAEHPQAESIRYIQDNILDILEELEGAGTIKINC